MAAETAGALNAATQLWQVDASQLELALLRRTITAGTQLCELEKYAAPPTSHTLQADPSHPPTPKECTHQANSRVPVAMRSHAHRCPSVHRVCLHLAIARAAAGAWLRQRRRVTPSQRRRTRGSSMC